VSGEFVAAMEDVLELYAEADDPKRPRVNFDECSVELHGEAREPEPPAPGRPARVDYEYVRNGTANLFILIDPHAGRRHVTVTERRTKADFAGQMKHLCDELYPEADEVRVVLDNLNTHTLGALYEAFSPEEARRLAAKLEFHYTPKHASWLNMAELELSVLARQCLSRRIPDADTLAGQIRAWQDARNRDRVRINWCFKVADARKKIAKVYPQQTPAADH
jgi:DDE superfamily endonuclease